MTDLQAAKTGTHDDLVIAVMLATLIDASTADVTYSPSPWW